MAQRSNPDTAVTLLVLGGVAGAYELVARAGLQFGGTRLPTFGDLFAQLFRRQADGGGPEPSACRPGTTYDAAARACRDGKGTTSKAVCDAKKGLALDARTGTCVAKTLLGCQPPLAYDSASKQCKGPTGTLQPVRCGTALVPDPANPGRCKKAGVQQVVCDPAKGVVKDPATGQCVPKQADEPGWQKDITPGCDWNPLTGMVRKNGQPKGSATDRNDAAAVCAGRRAPTCTWQIDPATDSGVTCEGTAGRRYYEEVCIGTGERRPVREDLGYDHPQCVGYCQRDNGDGSWVGCDPASGGWQLVRFADGEVVDEGDGCACSQGVAVGGPDRLPPVAPCWRLAAQSEAVRNAAGTCVRDRWYEDDCAGEPTQQTHEAVADGECPSVDGGNGNGDCRHEQTGEQEYCDGDDLWVRKDWRDTCSGDTWSTTEQRSAGACRPACDPNDWRETGRDPEVCDDDHRVQHVYYRNACGQDSDGWVMVQEGGCRQDNGNGNGQQDDCFRDLGDGTQWYCDPNTGYSEHWRGDELLSTDSGGCSC